MKLEKVAEIIWQYYQQGRAKVTAQTFDKRDIAQMIKFGYADAMRQQYIESRKRGDGNDYSFLTNILNIKTFVLSDANSVGMRRADLGKEELISLPKNAHITNVYGVGSCNELIGDITQVSPGEENFYLAPEFEFFKFFCLKGRGINAYHLPSCVEKLDVEATFDVGMDLDIPLDVAYTVGNVILGVNLKLRGFPIKPTDNPFNPNATEFRRRLEETEDKL